MAVREIPAAFEHKCDGCGLTETTNSKSRPKYWSNLTIAQDAYDYQGAAVADGTIRRLLCRECTSAVSVAMNSATQSRRAALKELPHEH